MSELLTVESQTDYWNDIAEKWGTNNPYYLWRRHCDAVNGRLVERWLDGPRVERILKTDLFDEAMADGLVPLLETKATRVLGIDLSAEVLTMATKRYPSLSTHSADVRELPFEDAYFDAVVSLSTLDHFRSLSDVSTALEELHRVLRSGGRIVLTMDNLVNPAVWLRNALPFALLNRVGLVPYFVGKTCGPHRLQRLVRQAGFEITGATAVMHVPRALAVAAARWIQFSDNPSFQHGFLRFLNAFERLGDSPTRFLTGNFIAIRADKP